MAAQYLGVISRWRSRGQCASKFVKRGTLGGLIRRLIVARATVARAILVARVHVASQSDCPFIPGATSTRDAPFESGCVTFALVANPARERSREASALSSRTGPAPREVHEGVRASCVRHAWQRSCSGVHHRRKTSSVKNSNQKKKEQKQTSARRRGATRLSTSSWWASLGALTAFTEFGQRSRRRHQTRQEGGTGIATSG